MNRRVSLVLLAAAFASGPVVAYEWKSHKGMAANARDIFLGESPSHKPPYAVDRALKDFLATFAADLDTRAGDEFENAFTDEDHNEGYLREIFTCTYQERDCWHVGFTARNPLWVAPCTLDHFFPKLWLPVPNQVAPVHARYYFDMAVKLYKAAKCDRWGLRETYMRGPGGGPATHPPGDPRPVSARAWSQRSRVLDSRRLGSAD